MAEAESGPAPVALTARTKTDDGELGPKPLNVAVVRAVAARTSEVLLERTSW
ncbi:MAG: hypothetical protein FD126_261 [Elusimicrobia bacterium]|nr:MAG: hypothetical protein FD126_261 [Elusimicrobiota bacterium]